MVEGALAIIKTGSKSQLAVYRGRYSEYFGKSGAKYTQSFAGEDPLVFSHQRKDGGWITRYYFFKILLYLASISASVGGGLEGPPRSLTV